MEIRQLLYFVEVVEAGSFSKAAEQLYVTQPALSWNIRKIEEKLDTQLLHRTNSGIALTSTGQIFYDESKAILAQIENMKQNILVEQGAQPVAVKVAMTILSAMHLRPALTEFMLINPKYQIDIIETGSIKAQERVMKGRIDIAITSAPIVYDALEVRELTAPYAFYDVAFVVSKNNPLSKKEVVTMKDLEDQNIASLSADYALRKEIDERFKELNMRPTRSFVNENWQVLVEHVAAFNTVTILPKPLQEEIDRDDVVWLPLDDEKIGRYQLFFTYLEDNYKFSFSNVAKDLYTVINQAFCEKYE